MFIRELNLDPYVKQALFECARMVKARITTAAPELAETYYLSVGILPLTNFYQPHRTNVVEENQFGIGPVNVALPPEATLPHFIDDELRVYLDRFKLFPYFGFAADANWGVHRHVYDPICRFSLTLFDSDNAAGSKMQFWNVHDPSYAAEPDPIHVFNHIPEDYPLKNMELLHEAPIKAGGAYLINTWYWHSHTTPGSPIFNSSNTIRIIAHLLTPDRCTTTEDAQRYGDWLENL